MAAQTPLLDLLVGRLRQVPGVAAVVLGGSRARGNAGPTSDYDLGLYYTPDHPLDTAALAQVASSLDDNPRPGLATPIGEWGPWINGGGWLHVQGQPVDLLYRDLARVAQVVEACRAGQVQMDYQPGHPHGFVSAIYLAEVAHCHVLWDPDGVVAGLKALAFPYPSPLQQALVAKFAWEARFALENAHKAAARGDVAYVAGCGFRSVACLTQVLFARNQQYLLNEKGAVALAATLPEAPTDFAARVDAAFARLAPSPVDLTAALQMLGALVDEVAS